MRIRVAHETHYRYEHPAKSVIQALRLTPRSHDGQHVARWRISVDQDVRLSDSEDAFGNVAHVFSIAGTIESVRVRVEGEVETHDTAGVLRGVIERFPVSLYLRETSLTQADEAIRAFARDVAGGETGALATGHALMHAIGERITVVEDPKQTATPIADAFGAGRGICQDLAHLFVACARELKIPARYVSGLLHRRGAADANADAGQSVRRANASHAWAEAHVEGLGWVGFDPSLAICPMEAHIRVAAALDYLGAAPVRGAHYGGDGESLDVTFDVGERSTRAQSQRQSQG